MLTMSILTWKWLEVGCKPCYVIVIDGKTKFSKKRLNYDNGLGLEAK